MAAIRAAEGDRHGRSITSHGADPTSARYDDQMRQLRLTHPAVDFWVDVRLREFDGHWLAVADLADQPDIGVGFGPREALREALDSLPLAIRDQLVAFAVSQLAAG